MLGAYWGVCPDSLEGCVDRVERFFAGLAEIDPLLSHWCERGWSHKDALARKVDASDVEKLEELLLEGRNRRDVGGEVIEELGFKLSLWNGADVEEAAFRGGSCSPSFPCLAWPSRPPAT
ncbi:Imm52 family immunity protein [Pigmentiphaga sp.]|uniref:Imm52 family immunity protein n=1 Tax=Pigmentiphaga sp. TaxID=1977564 RepID=UPI003435CDC6